MGKEKVKQKRNLKDELFENYSKRNVTVYLVLRGLVILTLIRQAFLGNWNNVFLCAFTLILFLVPAFIDKKLNIAFPDTFQLIILLFIFSAEILGEINEFYLVIPHWDTLLHTMNGFLCAALGFSLIDILNQKEFFHATMSPIFVALVAFCVSMTIGVLWEFFEIGMDQIFKTDMQKDSILSTISTVNLEPDGRNVAVVVNEIQKTIIVSKDSNGNLIEHVIEGGYLDIGLTDTMKDLIVNFLGAVAFSILGLLYIKDRDEYKFAEQFIPKLRKKLKESKENIIEDTNKYGK